MSMYPVGMGFLNLREFIGKKFPGIRIVQDDSIGLREDLIHKLQSNHFSTIRYRNKLIRVPATTRIPLYKNRERNDKNYLGYLVIPQLSVFRFGDLEKKMTDERLEENACTEDEIIFRKKRLEEIYNETISSDHPVSVYFIHRFIDEKYYFDYLKSLKIV